MSQFTSNIKDENMFISELEFFIDYFKNHYSNPSLNEANKIINQITHVVKNNESLIYDQKEYTNTRNIEEWPDGISFLNSEIGKRYINLLHYFSKSYEIKNKN